MKRTPQPTLRQVAVLVASLDEALGRRLLAELPAAEAAAVRAEIDRLDAIDPEEQQRILEDFRSSRQRQASPRFDQRDGVEAVFSSAAAEEAERQPTAAREAPLARSLAGMDAAAVAGLLQREHPQTIAAALARMDHDQAAAIFARLPEELRQDVLLRVADLQPADEQALAELEAQLVQWSTLRLQQQRRLAANESLARRLAAHASPSRIAPPPRAPLAATHASAAAEAAPPAGARQESAAAGLASRWGLWKFRRAAARRARREEPVAAAAAPPLPPAAPPPLEDCSGDLERLDDRSLLQALRCADEHTVRLALASSSESFRRRIERKLPRRQAAQLRRNLFAVGPARLSDLRRAQHSFLELARR